MTDKPPLDDTLSRLLAAFPADPTADALASTARSAAAWLLSQGWTGGGAGYSPGCSYGAGAAASTVAVRLLGRALTWEEARALEACIRACLDAAESERKGKR